MNIESIKDELNHVSQIYMGDLNLSKVIVNNLKFYSIVSVGDLLKHNIVTLGQIRGIGIDSLTKIISEMTRLGFEVNNGMFTYKGVYPQSLRDPSEVPLRSIGLEYKTYKKLKYKIIYLQELLDCDNIYSLLSIANFGRDHLEDLIKKMRILGYGIVENRFVKQKEYTTVCKEVDRLIEKRVNSGQEQSTDTNHLKSYLFRRYMDAVSHSNNGGGKISSSSSDEGGTTIN